MAHLGMICPAESGHLNTMLPLGQELQRRGHRVTLISVQEAEQRTVAAGLEFKAIGADIFPPGAWEQRLATLGQLSGGAALKYTIALSKDWGMVIFRDLPGFIREAGIQGLLVDQIVRQGGTVAEFVDIPFVTICSAVVLNREPGVPPFNTPWGYRPDWVGRLRNQVGYQLLTQLTKPLSQAIATQRQTWNLPPYRRPNDAYSPLAQISHQPPGFEFPRTDLPPWFHFTGPFHYSSAREPVPFPWERLTDQPLIYASLGTLQNRQISVFEQIAQACQGLNAQLVITLGGSASSDALPSLVGHPLVVGYAPQLDILKQTTLTITHAGMNTTLECLANGVPMVAIPVANDQPGIAARIAWSGVGEMLPLKQLNVDTLRQLIQQVLTRDTYRNKALQFKQIIQQAGGVYRASDIIEQAISTRQPVLAEQAEG